MLQTCNPGPTEIFSCKLKEDVEKEKSAGKYHDHNSIPRQRTIFSVSHFRYEFIRKATFDSWPARHINADDLAKAGFYYLKADDYVQCFCCKGVVGFWEYGDRPFIEHEKHFPRCPFVQGLWTGNVPISTSNEEEKNLYILLNKFLQKSLGRCRRKMLQLQTDEGALGTRHGYVYPSYNSLNNRIYSFRNWPKDGVPNPEKLAKVGFFSTGISDFVLCYCCGGGLFNWAENDDPAVDHQMYYSHCPLLKPNNSEIRDLESCSFDPLTLSNEEEDLLLQYPLSKKLIDMGLSSTSIKEALKEFLEHHLYLPATFMNCTDVVVEWDERQKKKLHSESQSKVNQSTHEQKTVDTEFPNSNLCNSDQRLCIEGWS